MRRFRIATALAAGVALAAMVAPAASQAAAPGNAAQGSVAPGAATPTAQAGVQAHWFFYASYNTLYTCNFVGGWLETQRFAQDHYCTPFTSNGTQYWALYVYA